jgi:DNA-binding CsgD family transcriptional regulator
MKGGAIDFLTKPIDQAALLASIERALELDRAYPKEALEHGILLARYQSLTPREQQVLTLLVKGMLNKQAAGELGITEYTVQIHRGHIMRKMEAESFATLVKIAGKLNLEPTPWILTGICSRRLLATPAMLEWSLCRGCEADPYRSQWRYGYDSDALPVARQSG